MKTYFISCGDLIKIGRSIDPQKRLAQFQTSSHLPLILILVLAGNREKELHTLFAADRINGEWFKKSSAIDDFIIRYGTLKRFRRTNHVSFRTWLAEHTHEDSDVGRFAYVVGRDRWAPKSNRLFVWINYYTGHTKRNLPANHLPQPDLIPPLKLAHKEWRTLMRDWKLLTSARFQSNRPRLVKTTDGEAQP